ncbi:PLB1 [Bugula neritina]|uniref:PLB1 n=1 Tax=Bugula neritina TaxID=10212 RepID=A0A7J7KAD7_BUGNE|nr:PLB1 [Bugula neritina]
MNVKDWTIKLDHIAVSLLHAKLNEKMRVFERNSTAFSTFWFIFYCLVMSATGNFLCPGNYTSPPNSLPTNVHSLKPGDIKILAGMGDSLTTGTGARATKFEDNMIEYRGRSFSTGGDATYISRVTTFANILKLFNPHVDGFSMGLGSSNSMLAGLNVGQLGASAKDMPAQAHLLVEKIKNNVWMNIRKDWKIVTMLVGTNDLCKFCEDKVGVLICRNASVRA